VRPSTASYLQRRDDPERLEVGERAVEQGELRRQREREPGYKSVGRGLTEHAAVAGRAERCSDELAGAFDKKHRPPAPRTVCTPSVKRVHECSGVCVHCVSRAAVYVATRPMSSG
jgi:hypothetical protein